MGGGPAADAEEEARRRAWSTYLDAIAPYLILLVCTPFYDPRGAPRELLELHARLEACGLTRDFLAANVYLSRANLEAGRWWTLVLHQFAHSDLEHLMNNVLTIVLFGRPVHRRVGTRALYALLLGGSTAAGYLHILGRREESHVFAGVQGLLPRNPFGGATRAGRWYDASVSRFAGWLSPRVARHVSIPAIGASGGACCLMGASVVIQLEELVGTAGDLIRARRRGPAEREVVLRRSLVRLVFVGAWLGRRGRRANAHPNRLTAPLHPPGPSIHARQVPTSCRWGRASHRSCSRPNPGAETG